MEELNIVRLFDEGGYIEFKVLENAEYEFHLEYGRIYSDRNVIKITEIDGWINQSKYKIVLVMNFKGSDSAVELLKIIRENVSEPFELVLRNCSDFSNTIKIFNSISTQMCELSLMECNIDNESLMAVVDLLKISNNLIKFNISHILDDIGLGQMLDALTDKHLDELMLRECELSGYSTEIINGMLDKGTLIGTLDLWGSKFVNQEGIITMLSKLEQDKNVLRLCLFSIQTPNPVANSIINIVKFNNGLVSLGLPKFDYGLYNFIDSIKTRENLTIHRIFDKQ